MAKNPKQQSYSDARGNSASPANSVPGDRNTGDDQPEGIARRRVFKQNAMLRGDPDGVEGGHGDNTAQWGLKTKDSARAYADKEIILPVGKRRAMAKLLRTRFGWHARSE